MKEKDKYNRLPSGTDKRNPFTVPENYFDNFPARVGNRLEAVRTRPASLEGRVWEALRPQLYLAAAILGFALIGYFGFRSFLDTGRELLSNEEINGYIEFYEEEFSGSYFLSLLTDNEFYFEEGSETDYGQYYGDADLYIEYLYMDNIDMELILNEY